MDLKVVCQKKEANETNALGPFIHCRRKSTGTNRLNISPTCLSVVGDGWQHRVRRPQHEGMATVGRRHDRRSHTDTADPRHFSDTRWHQQFGDVRFTSVCRPAKECLYAVPQRTQERFLKLVAGVCHGL